MLHYFPTMFLIKQKYIPTAKFDSFSNIKQLPVLNQDCVWNEIYWEISNIWVLKWPD